LGINCYDETEYVHRGGNTMKTHKVINGLLVFACLGVLFLEMEEYSFLVITPLIVLVHLLFGHEEGTR
jgi:hypothetical protein